MKRWLLLSVLLGLAAMQPNYGLARQRGGGHTVWGDFKIDDSSVSGLKPETYHLVLYSSNGHPISRQMVTNNGRYRFFNVANGEYYIAIELESEEVTRIHLRLAEDEKTDIRHDIALEWRANRKAEGVAGTVAVADVYNRPPSNKEPFEHAEEAIRKKEFREAMTLLSKIVTSDPKDFAAWTELGTVYYRLEKLGDAEKAYQRALQEKPSFVVALLNLGKLRLAKKDFEAAIESLTLAVKQQPRSPDANFFLGEAYLQVKQGSKAVTYLYEAIRLDPVGKAEAHLRLAALYKGAGLKDKAVTEYEQFLAKRPDYPDREKIQQYIKENKKPQ